MDLIQVEELLGRPDCNVNGVFAGKAERKMVLRTKFTLVCRQLDRMALLLYTTVCSVTGLHAESKNVFFYYIIYVITGHTGLQAASQNGHLEVLRLLLRAGADLELEVMTCF